MTNDNDLLELLKNSPSNGFQELLSRHGSKLYRAASRLMRDKAEIEDVLQDSLVAVFKNIHSFNGNGELLGWLYRIVINTALMRLRQTSKWQLDNVDLDELRGLHQRCLALSPVAWPASVEEDLLRQEASRVIDDGIRRLPFHYRTVYVLSEIEGLATREIAEILELTPENVKSRLHRARLCLRQMLAEYFCERKIKSRPRSR